MSLALPTQRAYLAKIVHIAAREFLATAARKGFIFGVLFPPLLASVFVLCLPRAFDQTAPAISGEVELVDPTGQVSRGVRDYLQGHGQIAVVEMPADTELERAKQPLRTAGAEAGGQRLALAVIHPDAIVRAAGGSEYGSYDLFVREKLDDRIEREIRQALHETIIAARVRAAGLDRSAIDALLRVDGTESTTVATGGERKTNELLNFVLPLAFVLLLFMSIMIGGQGLMTTTIEEKSNRVAEVLLSAISPVQLMAGKILGQLGAGLVVLVLYSGFGIAGLVSSGLLGGLDWGAVGFLLVFFLLTYLVIGSIMAAIGSVVNELREAQPMMLPVVLVLMLPYLLSLPISRDPNSWLATSLSFLPPINGLVMLLRITSNAPPPFWQPCLSVVIGVAAAWLALWCAGKVFRIGLLMYGQPPTLRTLVRWIWAA
jgi:ABC-type Na+ efflux pump permease subunit